MNWEVFVYGVSLLVPLLAGGIVMVAYDRKGHQGMSMVGAGAMMGVAASYLLASVFALILKVAGVV